MDQYTLLEKEVLALQVSEEQYSLLLLNPLANSITREYHRLLVECIILLLYLILVMFIVGEEDFKASLDFYQAFNRQVFPNTFLIFSNMMIANSLKLSKRYQFYQLHVVPITLLQSIIHIKSIAGVKQDMVKQDAVKKQKSQFLNL